MTTRAKQPEKQQADPFLADLKALHAAMPNITKAQTAEVKGKARGSGKDYSFEYGYADLAHIMTIVRPLIDKHNFFIDHTVANWILTTTLMHISGETRATEWELTRNLDAQGRGSEMTYGRRYNTLNLLNIATEEDDDGSKASEQQRRQPPKQQAQTQQKAETKPKGDPMKLIWTIADPNTGEITEETTAASPRAIMEMVPKVEASLKIDPGVWAANEATLKLIWDNEKAGGVQVETDGFYGTAKDWIALNHKRLTEEHG